MMAGIATLFDGILGRGKTAVTVPVMDGPLRPNQLLETARSLVHAEGADNLISCQGRLWFSSGATLLELVGTEKGWEPKTHAVFQAPVSCLDYDGHSALAVGLDRCGIAVRGGTHDGSMIGGDAGPLCPTACLFLDPDTLLVANGSEHFCAAEWKHDLMSRGRSGSLWRFDLRSGKGECILDGLAFPYGLAPGSDGMVLLTECWAHRVLSVNLRRRSKPTVVLDELPGYPARLAPAAGSGFWLTIFAARSQLIEFVLTEDRYRGRMIKEIHPDHWVAPDLSTGRSYLEPLQGGGLKQMGSMKPWAPPRSYGLLVRCDDAMLPLRSYHSRADGIQHGITSVCERDGGSVLVSAKGPGTILDLGAT